jgi:hypothetical protein
LNNLLTIFLQKGEFMAKTDWMPTSRSALLAMAQDWLPQIKSRGKRDWRMDDEEIAAFEDAVTSAENENTRPKSQRTTTTNARLQMAFDNLTAVMRDTKKRFFHTPPLTQDEIISLGLKPKDTKPTPVGKPKGKAAVSITYTASGALQVNIKPIGEAVQNSKANYGFRIYYGFFKTSDLPPSSGKDLRESKFSRQKKILFSFEPEYKGQLVYFCVRYENSKGEAGDWGDLSAALIP